MHHCIGWCVGKCPLYRGVLYSERPLSEAPLYIVIASCINVHIPSVKHLYVHVYRQH